VLKRVLCCFLGHLYVTGTALDGHATACRRCDLPRSRDRRRLPPLDATTDLRPDHRFSPHD